jgi:hypothetical protein
MRFAHHVILSMLLGAAVGCGANVIFGADGGDGGSGQGGDESGGFTTNGPGPGPGPVSNSVTTSNMQDSVTSVAMSFCDDIGVCEGDGVSPSSGCLECSILGDNTDALDGGQCAEAYFTCLGQDGQCGNGEPCCAFIDCVEGCQQLPPEEQLDCICTNNGQDCLNEQQPGTCLGDHPEGLQRYIELDSCIYSQACPGSCQ